MNPVILGLDVGTNCVRVAGLEPGVPPILRVFGQVALPNDAVRNGEVIDAFAVTTTIERLWNELDLRDINVRIAVAGPRVVARVLDLPSMDEDELLAAVQNQVPQLVPYPATDAVFDFQVLGPAPEDVGPLMDRVLVAVAHRSSIERLLDAVEAAGLIVDAIDLVPLALVRSLGREAQATASTEAIVSFGAGTTTIVVHTDGVPQLIETVGRGSRRLTEALTPEFGTFATAEAVKRRSGVSPVSLLVGVGAGSPSSIADIAGLTAAIATSDVALDDDDVLDDVDLDDDIEDDALLNAIREVRDDDAASMYVADVDSWPATSEAPASLEDLAEAAEIEAVREEDVAAAEVTRVWDALEPSVHALLMEITRVLDTYRRGRDAQPITRVIVTGGGALLTGFPERLSEAVGLPVVAGRPRVGLDVADIGFPPAEYPRLDPYLPVPLGIAAGGLTTLRRIDMMPVIPPVARPSRAPTLLAVVFMLVLIAGMAVATVVRQGQRTTAQRQLNEQLVANKTLERQVATYDETAARARTIDAVRSQIIIQLSYDVAWSRLLQELAVTMPSDAFMTSFQGVSTAPGSTAPGVPPVPPGTLVLAGVPSGGVTINGAGLGFPSVAAWLQRVTEIKSIDDTWVTNAVKSPSSQGDVVLFTAAANLTDSARSGRLNRELTLNQGGGR